MIVMEVKGNLITKFLDVSHNQFQAIAHGANCHHAMASGIAADISRLIPAAVEADNRTARGDKTKLGKFSFADVEVGTSGLVSVNRRIYNLYTQFYPGPDARYNAVFEAFTNLNKHVKETMPGAVVAVPLIGCGIGGLDWEEGVKKIINYTTPDVDIVVYHFQK